MRHLVRVITCVALAIAMHSACAPARAQALPEDLNGDGFVGALDLQIVLTHWGQSVTPGDSSKGDVFPDGFIGLTDLSFLLLKWGQGTIPTPGGDASLGMNLSEVAYWSRELVFVDAVKSARSWVMTTPSGNPFDTGQSVTTDADGWPILQAGQAAHTIMLADKAAAYPTGTYTVTFDGDGQLAFNFDASNAQVTGPGSMTFQVNAATASGVLMRVYNSNPANHVRNIRVWMPGTQGAPSSFDQTYFIPKLQPFGVIRFMDWQQTNGSTQVSWANRSKPTDFTQDTDKGVAVEYMIELCNELGADAWVCMPHMADDDYVTQFATLVRDNLDPELNVYVEWSNEVWNVSFPQSKWVKDNSDGVMFSNAYFQKWAGEAANDFAIWKSVFANGGNPNRVIRVAAGQQANVWVTEQLTEALAGQYDAVSCAAYFDQRKTQFNASTTVQDIVDNAINVTIPGDITNFYRDHGDLAQQRSNELGRTIPLLAYEGGQHYTVFGNSAQPYYQAFKDVQTYENPDPNGNDMYKAYLDNMTAFDQAGGSLYMAYHYVGSQGPFGSWGHLQYQNETTNESPKYRALLDFSNE